MKSEQPEIESSRREPTRHRNLFRYLSSGTIFARFKVRGKQVKRSLRTQNLELAKRKLGEREKHEHQLADDRRRGKTLFKEALEGHLQSVKRDRQT